MANATVTLNVKLNIEGMTTNKIRLFFGGGLLRIACRILDTTCSMLNTKAEVEEVNNAQI